MHASACFFSVLAFLMLPRKSLKLQLSVFSIPTAPTRSSFLFHRFVFHKRKNCDRAKVKSTPKPRFQKSERWSTPVSLYFCQTYRSDILSST